MNEGFAEARQDRQELRTFIATVSTRSGYVLQDLILMLSDQLLQENIDRSKISREPLMDPNGVVYYENYSTDIDVVIQNDKTILIEVKSTADNRDIYDLIKKGELFKVQFDKEYDELMLVCLEINQVNFKQAIKQGIRVVAGKIA